jgi:hypothetical protein
VGPGGPGVAPAAPVAPRPPHLGLPTRQPTPQAVPHLRTRCPIRPGRRFPVGPPPGWARPRGAQPRSPGRSWAVGPGRGWAVGWGRGWRPGRARCSRGGAGPTLRCLCMRAGNGVGRGREEGEEVVVYVGRACSHWLKGEGRQAQAPWSPLRTCRHAGGRHAASKPCGQAQAPCRPPGLTCAACRGRRWRPAAASRLRAAPPPAAPARHCRRCRTLRPVDVERFWVVNVTLVVC